MQKWLNDLYAIILKNGFNPGGGGGGGSHSGQGVLTGKYLGDAYTDTQKASIANGTFDGLSIGDYWTINGINWRIADFDYYYNVGDIPFNKHHIVVVPDTNLYDSNFNNRDETVGSYVNSHMRNEFLDNAKTAFYNAFGNTYIPIHRGSYGINANNDGTPNSDRFVDMRVELMGEEQVYGHAVWSLSGYDVGTQKTQFRLFLLDQTKINIAHSYWLTNVGGNTQFCVVGSNGKADKVNASNTSIGVRPFACVVGD